MKLCKNCKYFCRSISTYNVGLCEKFPPRDSHELELVKTDDTCKHFAYPVKTKLERLYD